MIESNKRISIVVPTYNRPDYIDMFLKVHIPVVRKYNIEIIIADNNSTAATEKIVRNWEKSYPLIQYNGSESLLSADENAERALELSHADYTWMVGDGYEIPDSALKYVLEEINNSESYYDLVVVNLKGLIDKYDTSTYVDCNEILRKLSSPMACISCNIYHNSLIKNGKHGISSGTNFGQLGFILHEFASNNLKLRWVPNANVVMLKIPIPKKAVISDVFYPVFFVDWPNFIYSLPSVYDHNSRDCALKSLLSHGLISTRNTLYRRGEGLLTREEFNKYQNLFVKVAPASYRRLVLFVLLVPAPVCKKISSMIEWVRRKNYQVRKKLNPDVIM